MRKYQYYDTGADGDRDAYSNNWEGQTFTPETDHLLASVKLKLFRVGSPGTVKVSIRATSAGKPTGGDLCSGTIDGDTLTTDTNGEWYEITLGDGYEVAAETMYAIVIRAVNGDASNKVSARADTSSPTYTGGTHVDSSDSGSSWNMYSGVDILFEEWGTGPPSPTAVTWGNLLKSQISSEKIEEAITRMIQDHEDDPDAHIEEGESLQSHKASEIIDHVVASIIEDKVANKAITPRKLYIDKYYNQCNFESLDAWEKTEEGTGASVEIGGGSCKLTAGNDVGDRTYIYISSVGVSIEYELSPFVQISFKFNGDWAAIDVAIMAGISNPFLEIGGTFGFYWSAEDTKLYARTIYTTGMENDEITGYSPGGKDILRVELDYEENEIRYYLNNVLKVTKTADNMPTYTELITGIGVRNYSGANNESIGIWNYIFGQEIQYST